jgi:hypothetical protein
MQEQASEDRSYDKTARTYRFSTEHVAEIDRLAQEHQVNVSRVADLVLGLGLAQLASGQRRLQRRAVKFDVDLV